MIRNRLQKQIEFNTPISDEAIDLLKQLLKNNPTDRLGSNGVNEIKQHSFFHDLNWNNLFSQLNYLVIETQEIQILHLSKNNYRILQHNLFLKRITMINSLSKNLKQFLTQQMIIINYIQFINKKLAASRMDNGQIINFQDFNEIQSDQDYIAFTFSNKNKKLKNYEKALEKFKSSIQQGFFYINNNFDFFNLNKSQDGILIDEQNNIIELIDDDIIGTQLVIKKDKSLLLNDRKRHLINIDPYSYKIDIKLPVKNQKNNSVLNKIDLLIKEEKNKIKKKIIQKKL